MHDNVWNLCGEYFNTVDLTSFLLYFRLALITHGEKVGLPGQNNNVIFYPVI